MRQDPGSFLEAERDDYNLWAAEWIRGQLTRDDVRRWGEGEVSDHLFSLMDAVGVTGIQIAGAAEPAGHMVVVA